MKTFFAQGKPKSIEQHHEYKLVVLSYFDEDEQIYYTICPALDIAGSGISENESNDSFKVCLEEFIKYTRNKRTIREELMKLGWDVHIKGHSDFKAKAPTLDEIKSDPMWADVWAKNPRMAEQSVILAA